MNYKKLNQIIGWLVFLVATTVYFITIEDTVSLWDCGEYVTTAYKLEVGHPPGAPLFMVVGRLFSFFADPENVAVCINRLSALCSSLSILFMYWSITLLAKKMALRTKSELTEGEKIAILGSGVVGALAYTFSDSFWFSAVEGEVYAMASLFTAAIFWAVLKWDEEMDLLQKGVYNSSSSPDRWMLLIMFLLGLAIGVHLLGILVVPAIGYLIYFRIGKISKEFLYVFLGINVFVVILNFFIKLSEGETSFILLLFLFALLAGVLLGIWYLLYLWSTKNKMVEFCFVGLMSILILGIIQEQIIPGTISVASTFEVFFKNSIGLPFYSGAIFFFGLLVFGSVFLIRRARKRGQTVVYSATMGLVMLLIGYASFAVIVIRSNANTPLDENDPENLVTLKSYLKREQYGSSPLLYGQYWNSKQDEQSNFGDRSAIYLRRFVVTKGEDQVVKAFRSEKDALNFVKKNSDSGLEINEKYFESNVDQQKNVVATYSQNTIFPRMFSDEPGKIDGYKFWSGYDAQEEKGTEIGSDEQRLPTMGENLKYFATYQVGWMYWRYFMWNFVGRQNDIQGHNDESMRGNWISGISAVDEARVGNQSEFAPTYTSENPANNKFFFLPLILGIIGLVFHFYRSPKDAFVVFLAFFFTGIAIVVYLNQKTMEPRERDYAFAGSFYFFALWIGLGVYALYEAFTNFSKSEYKKMGIIFGGGLLIALIIDSDSEVSMPTSLSWIVISVVSAIAIMFMTALKKIFKSDSQGAVIACLLGLFVPVIMGMQGWDDHDRSLKTSARDLATNYLESCTKNSILFTNGDNDTFPLWYMQEVEKLRTDVRVCNLSLMQTDWYTDQMKMKAYESEALPIKFTEDQILMYAGNTDQVMFTGLYELFYRNAEESMIKEVIHMRLKNNKKIASDELAKLNITIGPLISSATTSQPTAQAHLEDLKKILMNSSSTNLEEDIYAKYRAAYEVLSGSQNGLITFGEGQAQQLHEQMMDFETAWDFADIDDIMAFTRDDKNLIQYDAEHLFRFFPAKGMILKVDKQNAVNSGLIKENQKKDCYDELRFTFDVQGITREQVMMLDILANNDWKRGIFFSSPGGSDVSMALYRGRYIKQSGMAFELSPLKTIRSGIDADDMYENLMTKYVYGEMNNPDVLTDYYTRRHTSQYRTQFATLAEDYLNKADEARQIKQMGAKNIELYRKAGRIEEADDFANRLKTADSDIVEYKKRAGKLLKRSLELMPASFVIDLGECGQSREQYKLGADSYEAYSDGTLQDYVGLLYRAGEKKAANELGMELARQFESILAYFDHSDSYFAAKNSKDLYAAIDGYLKISVAAMDPEFGDRNGALAKRTQNNINTYFNKVFPKIENELKLKAQDRGETSTGWYNTRLTGIHQNIQAIGVHYGILKGPAPVGPQPNNAEAMDIQKMMNQMEIPDSVNP